MVAGLPNCGSTIVVPCAAATAAYRDAILSGWCACPPGACTIGYEIALPCSYCVVEEPGCCPYLPSTVADDAGDGASPRLAT